MSMKLYSDVDIQNIANAIREKNGSADTYKVSEMAEAIENIPSGGEDWKPEPDWWDIDKILEEDTEDYIGKIICLIPDNNKTTTLPGWSASKIITSDGTTYTNTSTNISHTWDISKDKECSLGYKTRYVIYYFSNNIVEGQHTYRRIPEETNYCIFKNLNIKITNNNYTNGVFSSRSSLNYIKFINTILEYAPSFYGCSSLIGYENLKYNSTLGDRLFNGAVILKEKCINDYINHSNFTSSYCNTMFDGAKEIINLKLPENLEPSNLNNFVSGASIKTINKLNLEKCAGSNLFYQTTSLTSIKEVLNIKNSGFSINQASKLNHDTLLRFLNALYDYSSEGGTHTITFGTTNLAKLTDDEKAIGTTKGWTLS